MQIHASSAVPPIFAAKISALPDRQLGF